MKQEQIIYEEQRFYSLKLILKLQENAFRMCYLVKLAVAGGIVEILQVYKEATRGASGDYSIAAVTSFWNSIFGFWSDEDENRNAHIT